jgi:DNA-binding CsgD family transcriptional regulator
MSTLLTDAGELSLFLEKIYAAAVDSTLWRPVLARLMAETGSSFGTLFYSSDLSYDSGIVVNIGGDPALIQDYAERWWKLDPYRDVTRESVQKVREGDVLRSSDLVPTDEVVTLPYYEHMKREGWLYGVVATVRYGAELCMIALPRTPAEGEATDEHLKLLRLLVPHFQRAIAIHRELTQLRHDATVADRFLDKVPFGCVLLRGQGHIVKANTSARTVLDQVDGVNVADNVLSLGIDIGGAEVTDDHAYRAAFRRVVASYRAGHEATELFTMPKAGGGEVECLMAAVRDAATPELTLEPTVYLFIFDPSAPVAAVYELFRKLYRLTPSEATMAGLLLRGRPLDQISHDLGVPEDMARERRENIYRKVGVARQEDLVRVLMRSVAALVAPSFTPAPADA